MDIKSKEERSRNMSKIRSRDTRPEKFIRSLLHRNGLRFRVAYAPVIGRPDLYFTRRRVAVFVHGCYWHRHTGCRYAYVPKSNVRFWMKKFDANIRRDREVREALLSDGIRVLVIWECTVKKMMKDEAVRRDLLEQILSFLEGTGSDCLEL